MHYQLKRLSAPGFSFIELLLVVLLVSMAFVIFLGALSSNKQVNAQTRTKTIQAIMLNDIQEQIRSRRFDQYSNGALSTNLGPDQMDDYMLQFDGSDDYIQIPDDASLTSTSALTISVRFKKVSGSSWMSLVGKGTTDANEEYVLMVKDNQAYFDVGSGSGPYLQQSTTISTGVWHHIAAVHSRSGSTSTLKVYLNGEDIGGTTSGPGLTPNNNSNPLTIGSRFSTSNALFQGQIDEVRIWNEARTQAEIKSYMDTALLGSESNLIAYYNFNEGSGNTVNDLSGNGNHGTVNGATWVMGSTYEQNLTDFNDIDDFNDYEIAQIDGYPGFSLSVQVDYVNPASKFRSVMSSPTNYKRVITSVGHDAEEDLVDTLIFGTGL